MTWIDKLFGTSAEDTTTEKKGRSELHEVEQALVSVAPEKAPYIACVALLAARLAGADQDISVGERQRIAEVLQEQAQLSDIEAKAAVEIVSAQELANSIDHARITELMNEMATMEQKKEILRALFYVACDDDISEVESEKIRSISKALLFSNTEYISIRSEYSEHRSILKSIPK